MNYLGVCFWVCDEYILFIWIFCYLMSDIGWIVGIVLFYLEKKGMVELCCNCNKKFLKILEKSK